MTKRVKLMIGVIIFGLVMFGATMAYDMLKKAYSDKEESSSSSPTNSTSQSSSGSNANKIPLGDFTVTDFDGNEVKLSDFKGKAVVLNFWASWCPPCKEEMPSFQKIYDEYKDKEVVFMMVNVTDGMRETKEKAKAFIDETKYTFPVYLDNKGEVYSGFGADAIPITVFIDKEGYISKAYKGMVSEKKIRDELGKMDV